LKNIKLENNSSKLVYSYLCAFQQNKKQTEQTYIPFGNKIVPVSEVEERRMLSNLPPRSLGASNTGGQTGGKIMDKNDTHGR
jgi:hypothetical protein